jgi:N-acetylglucosaminyldiphosphoundecaprenol N-acetyl-beta-D-mannosaminyltransferase
MAEESFDILGVGVSATCLDDSVCAIGEFAKRKAVSYVCLVNTHVLISAVKDRVYRNVMSQSDWNCPDGMPLAWYARKALGLYHVRRVAGHSLMKRCFSELRDARHYFYGSTPETLDRLESSARRTYPELNIVGTFSPPFRELVHHEKREILSMINKIRPDIIWVALGAPRQEKWMQEMQSGLDKGVMIGVGAAFDYFAGNIRRPPVWLRRVGLEWLCRLYQDPRRLWKRYLVTNSLFVFYLLREMVLKDKCQGAGGSCQGSEGEDRGQKTEIR